MSVSYVECDQIVTRADGNEDHFTGQFDAANFPFPLPPVTPFPDPRLLPDLALDEFYYTPPVPPFAGSAGDFSTDRYNLGIVDENCYACNDRTYMPQYTGKDVDVYVLDTGIRYDHYDFLDPALSGTRARYGDYDAIDDFRNENQRGYDCHGHGTHCSGIATGRVSGVAKEANVYSVRVLDCNSFGGFSGIIRALDHVLTIHRAKMRL